MPEVVAHCDRVQYHTNADDTGMTTNLYFPIFELVLRCTATTVSIVLSLTFCVEQFCTYNTRSTAT